MLLGATLISHAQMPPGPIGTNTYVPEPPPTHGLYVTGFSTPEGKLPWGRYIFPGGDPNMTNFIGAPQGFVRNWTSDTTITPGDVFAVGMPFSSTNISTNYICMIATVWKTVTNDQTGVTSIISRSATNHMRAGGIITVFRVGVTNVTEIIPTELGMIRPRSLMLTTNYDVPYFEGPTNSEQILDDIARRSFEPPPFPFPPEFYPPGYPKPDPELYQPTFNDGPMIKVDPGHPTFDPLIVQKNRFHILSDETSLSDQFVTSFTCTNILGEPGCLYHLQMRHTLDDSSSWADVTNSAVWLNADGWGQLSISITNDCGDQSYFRLKSHASEPE